MSKRISSWSWPLAWLLLLGCWSLVRLNKLMTLPVHYDAEHNYLPAARRLLTEGWTFLLDPASYRVAPLSYIWPALWDAEPHVIRWANSVLYLACIVMLWRIGALLGGIRAAVVATLLFVWHPELIRYFPTELTEPIFIFGLLLFMLSCSTIVLTLERSRRAWIAAGALGLALTLLSRPVLQLIAPMMLLGLLFVAHASRRVSHDGRRVAQQLSLLVALALVPAALIIIKNGSTFGLWSISTGAGTGLYLGVHPLTQGAEPAFLGMDYDTNALAGQNPATGGDHLHIQADALQRQVALTVLRDMTASDAVKFFGRKLWWWLFHHPVTLESQGVGLRAVRIFELACIAAFCGLLIGAALSSRRRVANYFSGQFPIRHGLHRHSFQQRRAVIFIAILLAFGALLGQLLLVLYNSRYSIGMLEPFLIVLCAFSWSVLSQPVDLEHENGSAGKIWGVRVTAATDTKLVLVVVSLGALIFLPRPAAIWLKKFDHASIDPDRTGPTVLLFDAPSPRPTDNIEQLTNGRWRLIESPAAIVIEIHPPSSLIPPGQYARANNIWHLRFAVLAKDAQKCRRAEVGLTNPSLGHALQAPFLDLRPDGRFHDYWIYGTHNLRPAGIGDLRIAFHCPVGTEISWDQASYLAATIINANSEEKK